MAFPVRNCLNTLTLRQGVVLIAVVDLFLSAISLFLLLLCISDAQQIACVLEADIEDSAQREGISLSDDTSLIEIAPIGGHSQNKIRLHKAEHLALVVIVVLYIAVILVSIRLVSGLLLLYGAIMRSRQMMLPWVIVEWLGLVLICTTVLVFMYLVHTYWSLIIFVSGSLFLGVSFYNFLVVYSHYKELYEAEDATNDVPEKITFQSPGASWYFDAIDVKIFSVVAGMVFEKNVPKDRFQQHSMPYSVGDWKCDLYVYAILELLIEDDMMCFRNRSNCEKRLH